MYLIEKGKVKIGYYNEDGSEIVKAILTRGELFGEKAILGETIRNEFAQSIDDYTSICPIGVETMHDLMRNNKTFSFKIYKIIGFKFKKLERQLQILLFKDTKTRLLEFLNELCIDYGQRLLKIWRCGNKPSLYPKRYCLSYWYFQTNFKHSFK